MYVRFFQKDKFQAEMSEVISPQYGLKGNRAKSCCRQKLARSYCLSPYPGWGKFIGKLP